MNENLKLSDAQIKHLYDLCQRQRNPVAAHGDFVAFDITVTDMHAHEYDDLRVHVGRSFRVTYNAETNETTAMLYTAEPLPEPQTFTAEQN